MVLRKDGTLEYHVLLGQGSVVKKPQHPFTQILRRQILKNCKGENETDVRENWSHDIARASTANASIYSLNDLDVNKPHPA